MKTKNSKIDVPSYDLQWKVIHMKNIIFNYSRTTDFAPSNVHFNENFTLKKHKASYVSKSGHKRA